MTDEIKKSREKQELSKDLMEAKMLNTSANVNPPKIPGPSTHSVAQKKKK